jgi:hypothetical protein
MNHFQINRESEKLNFTSLDCDLKQNYLYSYKVVTYNKRGSVESNFSQPLLSKQAVPGGFESKITLIQLNDTLIRLDWYRPKHTYSTITLYNIYRDSQAIHTRTVLNSMNSQNNHLTYYDFFEFLPNTVYKYEVFACNEAGCSTDPETYFKAIKTRDQGPLRVNPAVLVRSDARSAYIEAATSVELKSNTTQKIVEYRFYVNNSLVTKSNNSFLNLHNLEPFTAYSVTVEACTFLNDDFRGCKQSLDSLEFMTNQTTPEALDSVRCIDMPYNEYQVNVNLTWTLPRKPNGVLRFVKLKRDGIEIFATNYLKNRVSYFYLDTQLSYGHNYSYELTFFNDASFLSAQNWHATMENVPQLMPDPKCGTKRLTEMTVVWSDPLYSNGMITKYEVKYKNALDSVWHATSLGREINKENVIKVNNATFRSFKLENLIPFEVYEFQGKYKAHLRFFLYLYLQSNSYNSKVRACNRIGCSQSAVISDRNCTNLVNLPTGLIQPVCSEILNVDSNRIDLYVTWYPPQNIEVPILGYMVSRSTIQISIAFDKNFNPLDEQRSLLTTSEIHKSMNLSVVDSNLRAFSTYDYFVEVMNVFGSRLTPINRIRTRPLLPANLTKTGIVLSVTNQSAVLNLRPPLNLNGDLINVSILMKRPEEIYFKTIKLYSVVETNKRIRKGSQLLKFLANVNLTELETFQNYQVKSMFCNQIGCLSSMDVIEFQTYDNDKLVFFNVTELKSTSFELVWSFKLGNPDSNKTIR